jgi:molybdopterin molybdotransferase
MISVSEARKIIQEYVTTLPPVSMQLQDALGYRLATDIMSPLDIPAYPQSSMDGYAFSFSDWKQHTVLQIKGEMAAGSNNKHSIDTKTAVRIFTGAAVPNGADTVVMQEKTSIINGQLHIHDEQLKQGNNVRLQGSEIKTGELALSENTILTPAAIGFLAGMGITAVSVYPPPRVTIIITGNELQTPGHPLNYGQVYDSNSFALTAVLKQAGIQKIKVVQVPDELDRLVEELEQAIAQTDLILLTGGVSVGDYDFVVEAATRCGITARFHKLKQRPGKPLFFGTKESKLVFGLPGNPSSVLTCFYMYVLPVIANMIRGEKGLSLKEVPLAKAYQKPAGLTHFLKGCYDGHTVSPLGAQESYRMHSFARANCLIEIGEQVTDCEEGELVSIHLLLI